MVAVAIVGILVSVAIPNFLTYQARARQAEAKTVLGGTFVAATAMYFSENGTYLVSSINDLSFQPIGNPRYSYWFPVNGVPTAIPGGSTATAPCNVNVPPAGVAASALAFTAGARGNIDSDATCDDWLINDANILTNTMDDVAN